MNKKIIIIEKNKNELAAVVVAVAAFLVLATMTMSTMVYAQTTTTTTPTTLSATTQEIIEEAQAACAPAEAQILGTLCVSVVHESPTTLVLEGDLLVVIGGGEIGYRDNPFIWQAVDQFKAQGYTLTSVLLTGQGSEANPHSWYIVMSK